MTTVVPLPSPSTPARGEVAKTWVERLVLAGFMDEMHFNIVAGEHIQSLDPSARADLLGQADAARQFVATLAPENMADVEVRGVVSPEVAALQANPEFLQAFSDRPYRFSYIRADRLIALQTIIKPRHDDNPSTDKELIDFCLPQKWEVPAEISLIPPLGPILLTSSSPTMQGVKMDFDPSGKVTVTPAPHFNHVQVRNFGGRYILLNGYHRVYDLLDRGCLEIPAVVSDAKDQSDLMLLQGHGFFNIFHVFTLGRPPLVKDFLTPAAIQTMVRERRFGFTITLDIKPFNIGI